MALTIGKEYVDEKGTNVKVIHRVSSMDMEGDDMFLGRVEGSDLLRKYWPNGKTTGGWPSLILPKSQ